MSLLRPDPEAPQKVSSGHHKEPSGGLPGSGAFCLCGRAVNPNDATIRDLKDQLDALEVERARLRSELESTQDKLASVDSDIAKVRQQLLAIRCLDSKL